jgi:hypothetical protein
MSRLHRIKRARAGLCATSVGVSFFLLSTGTVKGQCNDAYNLSKSTIDGGGVTFATGSVYHLGATTGQHDAGRLLGTTYVLTGGFWSPRTVSPPSTVIPDPLGGKNRYVSFTVPPPVTGTGSGNPTAIRITLLDLQNPVPPNAACCPPPNFSAFESATCTAAGEQEGCARWVGRPQTFLESGDSVALGSFHGARLQCSPFYHDWSREGLIQVTGAEIVPSSRYEVQVFAASCKGNEDFCTAVSNPVSIVTRRSGDITPRFNPPDPSTQPDALDVNALVNKFKNLPGAPIKAIAQLQPNLPELNADINALDISAAVDAFKGFAYPFGGPCPCPSLVTCGSTACTSDALCITAFGPASMCVKTCNDGPNAGLPCKASQNCNLCSGGSFDGLPCDPGAINVCFGGTCPNCGVCGSGFCRDKCGRCKP